MQAWAPDSMAALHVCNPIAWHAEWVSGWGACRRPATRTSRMTQLPPRHVCLLRPAHLAFLLVPEVQRPQQAVCSVEQDLRRRDTRAHAVRGGCELAEGIAAHAAAVNIAEPRSSPHLHFAGPGITCRLLQALMMIVTTTPGQQLAATAHLRARQRFNGSVSLALMRRAAQAGDLR